MNNKKYQAVTPRISSFETYKAHLEQFKEMDKMIL